MRQVLPTWFFRSISLPHHMCIDYGQIRMTVFTFENLDTKLGLHQREDTNADSETL